jgi:Uncharacterised nucleotidyltransferase
MMFEGVTTEDRLLLQAVRWIIPDRVGRGPECAIASDGIDWQQLGAVATQNKLGTILLRGLERGAVRVPQNFRALLAEQRDATVRLNTKNLLTMRHLVPLLEARGISTVAFKGPCAQMLVYGDFFAKPSLDVDLLVRRADFDTVSGVIADNGFALAQESASVWWRVFLGEQAFLSRDRAQAAVDLHYRLQQPGCPAPRECELFLAQSVTVAIGSTQVRTPSRTNATLLSCMSLAKALVHREPAGGYACDIAAGLAGYAQGDMEELVERAERQGLHNTLALGLRAAGLLFDVRETTGTEGIFADIANANLIKMILRPWAAEIEWPRRSAMLRELCDTRGTYLKEMGWKLASEICRNLYERQIDRQGSRNRSVAQP